MARAGRGFPSRLTIIAPETPGLEFVHLTTDIDDTNLTVYTTGSFTSTIDQPLFVGVLVSDTNPAGIPSLSKTGVTLTHRGNIEFDAAGTRRTIFLFSGTPTSTSTGVLTITATEEVSGCGWTCFEALRAAATPIVGSAVTNSGSGTSISATLPAFASGDDAAVAVMAVDVDGSFTSDFTILGQDVSAAGAPVQCIASMWRGNDTTVTATGPDGLWGIVAVEIRAATAAEVTPIAASDSPTVSVTEASSSLLTSSLTDSPSVAVTEVSASALSSSVSDSPTMGVTETSASALSSAVSDAPAVGVTESSAVAVPLEVQDSPTLTVTEASALVIGVTGVDSPTVGLTEAVALDATSTVTDAPAVGVTDTSAMAVTLTVSDAPTAGVTEAGAVQVAVSTSDAPAVTVAEVLALGATSTVTDTPSVSTSESTAVASTSAVSDTVTVGLTDSGAVTEVPAAPEVVPPTVADLTTNGRQVADVLDSELAAVLATSGRQVAVIG